MGVADSVTAVTSMLMLVLHAWMRYLLCKESSTLRASRLNILRLATNV